MQPLPGGDAEDAVERADRLCGERGDGVDAVPVEPLARLVPHAPQRTDGQRVEEGHGLRAGHEEETVGLGVARGELGDELRGCDADGRRHAELGADPAAQLAGDRHGRAEPAARPGHVEERLVDAHLLHDRGDLGKDVHHLPGGPGVAVVVRWQHDSLRAQPPRLGHRHRRVDAEPPRLVRGGEHHPALLTAHDDRPPEEVGAVEELDGGEERVHVDVQDRAAGVVGAPVAPGVGTALTPAHPGQR